MSQHLRLHDYLNYEIDVIIAMIVCPLSFIDGRMSLVISVLTYVLHLIQSMYFIYKLQMFYIVNEKHVYIADLGN